MIASASGTFVWISKCSVANFQRELQSVLSRLASATGSHVGRFWPFLEGAGSSPPSRCPTQSSGTQPKVGWLTFFSLSWRTANGVAQPPPCGTYPKSRQASLRSGSRSSTARRQTLAIIYCGASDRAASPASAKRAAAARALNFSQFGWRRRGLTRLEDFRQRHEPRRAVGHHRTGKLGSNEGCRVGLFLPDQQSGEFVQLGRLARTIERLAASSF